MLVTVVIPTYRRPGPLLECVRSLLNDKRWPDEVVVVGREGDTPTREAIDRVQELCAGKTALRAGFVTEPGHLPPIRQGLALATGEIVAFLDDDVTIVPEWLDHLLAPFADPSVGVIGGRVITPSSQLARLKGNPGRTSWYGKHWGNVAGLKGDSPFQVEAVMECNWAWRRGLLASLKFDPVLNFDDASMYGLDLCLQARSMGFLVLYEPRALAYHHVAQRAPGLDRADRPKRSYAYSRNYTYIMLKHLPWWRRGIFLAWWFLVGERGALGLVAILAETLAGRLPRSRDMWSALSGKIKGILLSASETRARA
jgi:GT2 family glycosyltransferase